MAPSAPRRCFLLCGAALALLGVTASSTRPQPTAHGLTLLRSERLAAPSPLTGAVYVRPEGLALIALGGWSEDNGRTWMPLPEKPDFAAGLPAGYRRVPVATFLDPVRERLLRVVNSLDTPGLDPKVAEPTLAQREYYLRYRVSRDGGRSWLFDAPIVQRGDYTARNPFPGVRIGKNAIYLGDAGCLPIRTRGGKVLLPAQVCVAGPDGELANPGGGLTYTDAVVLIGTWRDDDRLEWESSQRLEGDPARSTRGMIEPTLAELPDGRILVVMRGSNGGKRDPEFRLPGTKWHAFSRDGGRTWSKPEPWRYADGGTFYSPSSMSQLLRHSSGRLFWIGNLTPENPRGNLPRDPLVIGEVDRRSGMLLRDSVLTLDARGPEDTQAVLLSPHTAAFEDRETGEIVLPMGRETADRRRTPTLYRIGVR